MSRGPWAVSPSARQPVSPSAPILLPGILGHHRQQRPTPPLLRRSALTRRRGLHPSSRGRSRRKRVGVSHARRRELLTGSPGARLGRPIPVRGQPLTHAVGVPTKVLGAPTDADMHRATRQVLRRLLVHRVEGASRDAHAIRGLLSAQPGRLRGSALARQGGRAEERSARARLTAGPSGGAPSILCQAAQIAGAPLEQVSARLLHATAVGRGANADHFELQARREIMELLGGCVGQGGRRNEHRDLVKGLPRGAKPDLHETRSGPVSALVVWVDFRNSCGTRRGPGLVPALRLGPSVIGSHWDPESRARASGGRRAPPKASITHEHRPRAVGGLNWRPPPSARRGGGPPPVSHGKRPDPTDRLRSSRPPTTRQPRQVA